MPEDTEPRHEFCSTFIAKCGGAELEGLKLSFDRIGSRKLCATNNAAITVAILVEKLGELGCLSRPSRAYNDKN